MVKDGVLGVVGDVLGDQALHGGYHGHVVVGVGLGDQGVYLVAHIRPVIFTDTGDADLFVERRLRRLRLAQDLLVELLPVPQAGVLDLHALRPAQLDHATRQVGYAHRLAHVEDEDLAALPLRAGLKDKLAGLWDQHEVPYDVGIRHRHRAAEKDRKATIFGYWVNDPERYGVAEFDEQGNCLSIEEKPAKPKSNYAVPGLYFYPNEVVEVARTIKPSARGEYEITTVNQVFLKNRQLKVQALGRGFAWLDTGTHDSLAEASTFVEVIEKRQGLKIACLEAIAFRKGWIDEDRMRELAQPMLKNQYGQYLLQVIEEKRHKINSDTLARR